MRFTYAREALALGWVLVVALIGIVQGFGSVAQWSELAALAVVPIVILALFWRTPSQTLSESIHQARD